MRAVGPDDGVRLGAVPDARAYIFGYDARLKAELARHLELCAETNAERLTKEGILEAVPEELREPLRKAGQVLGPGALQREASRVCGCSRFPSMRCSSAWAFDFPQKGTRAGTKRCTEREGGGTIP